MKSFPTAVFVAIGLGAGSAYFLTSVQQQADEAFASHSGSVRLPDHGVIQNLVGNDWYSLVQYEQYTPKQ